MPSLASGTLARERLRFACGLGKRRKWGKKWLPVFSRCILTRLHGSFSKFSRLGAPIGAGGRRRLFQRRPARANDANGAVPAYFAGGQAQSWR